VNTTDNQHAPEARLHRARWLVVVPILLLAVWLGGHGLNADALWYDEWLSVYYAGGGPYGPLSPPEIWARVAEHSTWPPGFQTVLAGWGALVGWDQVPARVFPFLVGILSVAWMYRLGREMVSRRVGVYAAFLLGASAFFANYLNELRGYTLYVLFSTLCVWGYWRLLRGRAGAGTQFLFVLSIAGSLYTHYFAAFTPFVIALYHLLLGVRILAGRFSPARNFNARLVETGSSRATPAPTFTTPSSALLSTPPSVFRSNSWWRVPLLMAFAVALFLPWAGVAFSTTNNLLEGDERRVAALTIPLTLELMAFTFSNGSIALLALVGMAATRARSNAVGLAWFWLLSLLGVSLLVNERLQIVFHIRHLIALWCPLALVTALGIRELARRGIHPLLVLGIWGVAGVYNAYNTDFIDTLPPNTAPMIEWEGLSAALETVEARSGARDRLMFHVITPGREWLTEPVLDYYADALPTESKQIEEIPGLEADDDYYNAAREYIEEAPFVWTAFVPDVPSPYQVEEFQRALAADFASCGRLVDLPSMQLDLYSRPPDRERHPAPFHFGDDIDLWLLQPLYVSPERTLDILLGWSLNAFVSRDTYSVALHLIGSDGNLVTQADYGLPNDPYSCRNTRLDLRALPPGTYSLRVIVYNWQTGERLPGAALEQAGDGLTVETFALE